MFSVNDFLANVKGPAIVNKYIFTISYPELFTKDIPYQYLAKDIVLPGYEMTTTSIGFGGMKREVIINLDYDPMTVTFVCESDMKIRDAFNNWVQDSQIDTNNYTVGYYKDYVKQIQIDVLNKENKIIHSVQLHEAYPKSISEISLGYDNNDQAMEFTVTFNYWSWSRV